MAEKKNEAAVVTLPPETIKRLTDLETDISNVERSIEVLKKLGMDVRAIEEKLIWTKEVRKTLLTEFGK